MVVHEAHQNNGWGAQVVSQVGQMVFPYLDAAPVHIGDVVIPDIAGTGVDLIATADREGI